MSFDFDKARRWARAFPAQTLARRDDDALPFVQERDIPAARLIFDTCCYIDQMQARLPAFLQLASARHPYHSAVAVQEMMHAVGALRPSDPRTPGAVRAIRSQIAAMPENRLLVPDADILGRAALLAGIMCRLQGYGADRRYKAQQDCVLFLQAMKHGLTVLTRDLGEYDILLQLIPTGRVLFYRPAPH